jgi:predicted homoserine dehydrogenase-like protein
LPIGLAHRVKLLRDIAAGEFVTGADVALDDKLQAVRIRREMETQARQMTQVLTAEQGAASSVFLQHSDVTRG